MGSRALKVLQLVHTLDPSVGGVAAAVVSLSRGIASRGHKIDIVVLDDSASPWLVDFGLPVHSLGVGLTSYRVLAEIVAVAERTWRQLRSRHHKWDLAIPELRSLATLRRISYSVFRFSARNA